MLDSALERRIERALEREDLDVAVTEAIRGYGPELLSYLQAVLREETAAAEVFSQFCEFLWKSLPKFRRESSFRTWAYKLAWSAVRRHIADPYRKRREGLRTSA